MFKRNIGLLTALILFLVGILIFAPNKLKKNPHPIPSPIVATSSGVLGTSGGCKVLGGLPDKFCTQGAIFEGVSAQKVCTPGYAKSVRNVSDEEKQEVFKEYNISSHYRGEFEIDHLIPLELGGSNELSNLWPEPAEPRPGFHEKDRVENFLHEEVCSGQISLQEAQKEIATNWLKVYSTLP